MEEHNLRIFLLCTHSVAGALPLGIIITSDEQLETLIQALRMFKDMLPPHSFFGSAEPDVFMSDNCSELREALHEVFPTSKLLLCTFHILQQVWRWLFEKKHEVNEDDRQNIMKSFRQLLHLDNEEDFQEKLNEFFDWETLTKYPAAVLYFQRLG